MDEIAQQRLNNYSEHLSSATHMFFWNPSQYQCSLSQENKIMGKNEAVDAQVVALEVEPDHKGKIIYDITVGTILPLTVCRGSSM